MIMPFLRAPSGLILDCLLLQMFESFNDCRRHVTGLGLTDQRPVPRIDRNFGLVAAFFHRQNHLGLKLVAENFADLCKTGFNFLANGGSNFKMPTSEFYVHERPSLK